MATYQFSALTNGEQVPFRPGEDVLNFDQSAIAAADIRVTTSGTSTRIDFVNGQQQVVKHIVLLNTAPAQLAISNVTFANGSRLLIGDTTTSTTADDAPNTLTGTAGRDYLNGWGGVDTMNGGAGDDAYFITAGDVINDTGGVDTVYSVVSYSLSASSGVENLTMLGTTGGTTLGGNQLNNILTGSDANNASINGRAGNDTMYGMGGNDTFDMSTGGTSTYGNDVIDGGAGVDTIDFGANARSGLIVNLAAGSIAGGGDAGVGTVAIGNVENVVGGGFRDRLTGDSAANYLYGAGADDTLDGGAGNDRLEGWTGFDQYVFSVTPGAANADTIVGFVGGSSEKIVLTTGAHANLGAAGNFTATDARFAAGAGFNSARDSTDRVVYNSTTGQLWYDADGLGGAGAQLIATLQGAPTLRAADIVVQSSSPSGGGATAGNDSLTGTAGNDTIDGLAGNDTINGLAGNDSLIGGLGSDSLIGGAGDDTYQADPTDVISDSSGIDTVVFTVDSSVGSYTLQAGLENLTIRGPVDPRWYEFSGNELNNRIVNELADTGTTMGLSGGAGTDTLIGGDAWELFSYAPADGHELIDGGGGTNRLFVAGTINFRSDLSISNIQEIYGGTPDDHLTLNDTGLFVSGGFGDDTIIGGAGNDTIVGDAEFEFAQDFTGHDFLYGGFGSDALWGERGLDTLDGGAGNDTLNGGIGGFPDDDSDADTYLFTVAPGNANSDTITFFFAEDEIRLDARVMTALGTNGRFTSSDERFHTGASAAETDDRVIYNSSTGQLWYDADGSGTGATQQLIATLSGAPALAATDISVDNGTPPSNGGQTINGTAGNDSLTGTSGNDTINGLAGSDRLFGAEGADSIDGGADNDTVDGGAGNDTLDGGMGQDAFSFTVAPASTNADVIAGFDAFAGGDLILLDASAHANIGALGGLGEERFFAGAGANSGQDATDRVIFNTTTGQLWYDADGNGSGTAQLIATLPTSTFLSAGFISVTSGSGINRVGTAGNDTLNGTAWDDTLNGQGGNDDLNGDWGRDSLIGGAGNDTLDAGLGSIAEGPWGDGSADTLDGGLGDDTYVVGEADDVILDAGGVDRVNAWNTGYTLGAGVENLVINQTWQVGTGPGIGNELDNQLSIAGAQGGSLFGMGGNDHILVGFGFGGAWGEYRGDGGEGNDTLEVIGDATWLTGGSGADRFLLAHISSSVITDFASGTDKIHLDAQDMPALGTGGNFAPNDERFHVGSEAAEIDDRIVWDAVNRTLLYDANGSGAGQAFALATLQAGATLVATDIVVDNGTVPPPPPVGGQTITGTAGNDSLTGTNGNDTLDGLGGNDTLNGGLGDDKYIAQAGDVIVDSGGIDTLETPSAWNLFSSPIDHVTLTGTAAVGVQANARDNLLIGNGANNSLEGRAGNDTIDGGGGNDYFRMSSSGGTTFGNDALNGGAGFDTVDYDLAQSPLSVWLGGGMVSGGEAGGGGALTLASIESFEAGGFDDRLTGSAGNDQLFGNAGNDTLSGREGVDTLSGGAGADRFMFEVVPGNANADRINDFAAGSDELLFSNSDFQGLGSESDWAAGDGRFRSAAGASSAADANDRLIYNTSTGQLYYDSDGVGGAGSQLVALLPNLPGLTAADISVI